MTTNHIVFVGAVVALVLFSVLAWRSRGKVLSGAFLLAGAAAIPTAVIAFEPENLEIAIAAGAVFVLAIGLAWYQREKRPIVVRCSLAIACAMIAPMVVAFVHEDAAPGDRVALFYAGGLRTSMFSGFLGLGGFLLSLKTFIVVKMKEGVFDTTKHRDKVLAERKRPGNEKLGMYEELDRLRRMLFVAIVSSITCAVLQVTVGLDADKYASTLCLTVAAFVIVVLVQVLVLINMNLRDWFRYLEQDSEARIVADAKKAALPVAARDEEATLIEKAEAALESVERVAGEAHSALKALRESRA